MTVACINEIHLSFGLRLRLAFAKMMEAIGGGTPRHFEAERLFSDIIREHGRLVTSICLSFSATKEDLEDLRQDSLLNIWRGIGSFRQDSTVSTWIYRVTLNTCLSSIRRQNVSEKKQEAFSEFYRELFDDSSAEEVERYEQMYSMIASLPVIDRSVLLMWLDEKSYEEIASVSGLTRNSVASRLKRVKDRLAAQGANQCLNH